MKKNGYVNPIFAEMLAAVPEKTRRESERSFAIAQRVESGGFCKGSREKRG